MTERAERRRHRRSAAKGSLTFSGASHVQHARIANLSAGGAFVLTNVTAPERLLGRTVRIEFRLDGAEAEWIATTGEIVRVANDGVAIAFETVSTEVDRMLSELDTASRDRKRVFAVVLLDETTERRTAMANGFASAGCTVIEAATPLEAIVRLGEATFEPDMIAISDSYAAKDADQMRKFVEREHPGAKLVTIGHGVPDDLVHWLSSADPDGDLAKRVRDVLFAPRKQR